MDNPISNHENPAKSVEKIRCKKNSLYFMFFEQLKNKKPKVRENFEKLRPLNLKIFGNLWAYEILKIPHLLGGQ